MNSAMRRRYSSHLTEWENSIGSLLFCLVQICLIISYRLVSDALKRPANIGRLRVFDPNRRAVFDIATSSLSRRQLWRLGRIAALQDRVVDPRQVADLSACRISVAQG